MSQDRLKRGLRVTLLGLAGNLLLASGKLTAGVAGHSYALVADGVESLADLFSSMVVWHGLVIAARPADRDHPYGHGKAEPIAAAVVATMLLLAAVGIGSQSLREMANPHHAPQAYTLLVLLTVVFIKEGLFRFVYRESQSVGSTALRTDAWHHRTDAITSLAAATGITIALVGGKGCESADNIAAIFAAGIIAWNGWRLLRPALNELMDAAPNEALNREVRAIAAAVSDVQGVEKCLVRKMGLFFFVDLHVEVDPEMTVRRSHEIAHQVKDAVRRTLPSVADVLVHIEPGGASRRSL